MLQIADKDAGELAGKGIIPVPVKVKYYGEREYAFNSDVEINIRVKDGKYKYQFKNFRVYYPPDYVLGVLTSAKECPDKFPGYSQKKTDEMWEVAKISVDTQVKALITSLKEAMGKKKSDADF